MQRPHPPAPNAISLRKKQAVPSRDPASLSEGGGAQRRKELLRPLRSRQTNSLSPLRGQLSQGGSLVLTRALFPQGTRRACA